MFTLIGSAQQGGPYKVLKTAKVGGEGGWDYIYADAAGRRLYIPRRGMPATPEVETLVARLEKVTGAGIAELGNAAEGWREV